MPYITRIEVFNHYRAGDLVIDLAAGEPGRAFRHLVITGPNASGKTTILRAIAEEVQQNLSGRASRTFLEQQLQALRTLSQAQQVRDLEAALHSFGVQLRWDCDLPLLRDWWMAGRFVSVFMPAHRELSVTEVNGPNRLALGPQSPNQLRSALLKQFLVNQHVQARLASTDAPEASRKIFSWLSDVEENLARLFGLPGLKVEFDRERFDIHFREPGGAKVTFDQLADGHASLLQIAGELLLRTGAAESSSAPDAREVAGVVMIDEIDTHLHPALQESVLPLLTAMFPRLQFLVATHSPAVISSAAGAIVFDLGTRDQVTSESLQGTPFGRLMTTHFGLPTDFDLESTAQLKRLDELNTKVQLTPDEQDELAALANRLRGTSHTLALEVWNRLQAERLRGGNRS